MFIFVWDTHTHTSHLSDVLVDSCFIVTDFYSAYIFPQKFLTWMCWRSWHNMENLRQIPRTFSLSLNKGKETHLQAPFSLPVSNFLLSLRRIIKKKKKQDVYRLMTQTKLSNCLCCGQLTAQQSDRSSTGKSLSTFRFWKEKEKVVI